MRTFGLLTCLATALSQEGDETAYLLQTRTQQQKSGDVDDCYVTGGCSTTAATEAPTTTTTEAPTTTTRPTRPATTTPRPTRPTRPATTTTEAPEPPPVGMAIEEAPAVPGVPKPSYDEFCTTGTVLSLSNPVINNLGGMGPGRGEKVIKYNHVAKVDVDGQPTAVNLVISTDNEYYQANIHKSAYGQTGKSFIGKYNGGGPSGRSDVMAIGSLATGDFTFKFEFTDDNGTPVVVPHLPMTFFDLDGSTAREARGKSYEVVTTKDSAGIESVVGSKVVDVCARGSCTANSAKEEITIPDDFSHMSAETKKAAVTFFFQDKSSFDITYTLNYEHRVFLFKGQCIDEEEETTTTKRSRWFR